MVNARMVWGKIFGHPVKSFTVEGKTYTVNMTEKGWECNCPDWEFRDGTYVATVKGIGELTTESFPACKHIIKVIQDQLEKDGLPKENVKWRHK